MSAPVSYFGTEFEYQAIRDDLAFATDLGRNGTREPAQLERLAALKESPDVLVRGYASWAWRQLHPFPIKRTEYHVSANHPAADDAGPGTAEQPWRTVQKAAEIAGAGDTVTIHAGLYREWVRPFFGGTEDAYLTFRAAPGETQPTLSAAEIWSPSWQAEETPGLYSTAYTRHAWDCPEKWSRPLSGAMHAAEQIIIDGLPLFQVNTTEEVRDRAGTFRADLTAGRLYLHLPGETELDKHVIERAMRQQVFAPAVRGLGYIRLQGLHFIYGSAPEWFGDSRPEIGQRSVVSVRAGHHWIIEDNLIEWGNAQGLDIGEEGLSDGANDVQPIVEKIGGHHQVRRNRVNHHAVAGIIGTGGVHDILFEENETNENAWKQNFDGYEAAGFKIHLADRCIIRKHRAHRNEAFGIWLDWDCRQNRVSECVMTENVAAGFFHEASPGPLLVDGNMVLNTRPRPGGDWGDGLYSHDGNHTTFIGNYSEGNIGYGARIVVLAGRTFNDSPTTGIGNKFFNNLFVNNRQGAISFQPDGPLFHDNQSEANLFWSRGSSPTFHLEDGGSGVTWETTAIGQAQGKTGGGNLSVSLAKWAHILGYDQTSLVLPLLQLAELNRSESEKIATLSHALHVFTNCLPSGLVAAGEVTARPVEELLDILVPSLLGYPYVRTHWLGPEEAVQIWRGKNDFQQVHWIQEKPATIEILTASLLASDPVSTSAPAVRYLSAGETAFVPLEPGESVSTLPQFFQAAPVENGVSVTVSPETRAGAYQMILQNGKGNWRALPLEVAEPLRLQPLQTRMEQDATAFLIVSVQNLSRSEIAAEVTLRFAGEQFQQRRVLKAESSEEVSFPITAQVAGLAEVTIQADQQTITHREAVSFVTAHPAADWNNVTWQSMNSFPDGVFPEGAQAFILFETKLTARFALRYDAERLYLRLEVNDAKHEQTKPDWQLYEEDGLEILIKPMPGAPPQGPYLFHLALHSEGDRQIARFRDRSRAAGLEDPTLNLSRALVTRQAPITTYDLELPWKMLNLSGPPAAEPVPLRLSLVLNNNDGYGRHGFEWFFGIFHHAGEDQRMGTVWLLNSH